MPASSLTSSREARCAGNSDEVTMPNVSTDERAPTRTRRMLCLATVAACVPYLALKVLWIMGIGVGVNGANFVADTRGANVLTAGLDLCAAALAVLFVRPGGRRIPAWLICGPVWVATGLLTPLTVGATIGFPVQALLDRGGPVVDEGGLNGWVFLVVYGGFILQALLLLPGFVLYAMDRWPAVFDAAGPRRVVTASERILGVAFFLGATTFALRSAYGAVGGGGLYPHPAPSQRVAQLVFAGLAVAGATAFWRLRDGRRPTRRLLVAAWIGSAVVFTESLVLVTGLVVAVDNSDRAYGPGGSLLCLFSLLAGVAGAAVGMQRIEQLSKGDDL
ncbi:hypothetical protein ACQHIV_03215 [Kribbella sp. GL6]|uniref:hypothetical protein n=1 Tax=Kribbella sp. GL6 TaxID=3419765 RepID=UPI003D00E827